MANVTVTLSGGAVAGANGRVGVHNAANLTLFLSAAALALSPGGLTPNVGPLLVGARLAALAPSSIQLGPQPLSVATLAGAVTSNQSVGLTGASVGLAAGAFTMGAAAALAGNAGVTQAGAPAAGGALGLMGSSSTLSVGGVASQVVFGLPASSLGVTANFVAMNAAPVVPGLAFSGVAGLLTAGLGTPLVPGDFPVFAGGSLTVSVSGNASVLLTGVSQSVTAGVVTYMSSNVTLGLAGAGVTLASGACPMSTQPVVLAGLTVNASLGAFGWGAQVNLSGSSLSIATPNLVAASGFALPAGTLSVVPGAVALASVPASLVGNSFATGLGPVSPGMLTGVVGNTALGFTLGGVAESVAAPVTGNLAGVTAITSYGVVTAVTLETFLLPGTLLNQSSGVLAQSLTLNITGLPLSVASGVLGTQSVTLPLTGASLMASLNAPALGNFVFAVVDVDAYALGQFAQWS